MAKRALITGITGQDGSYLAELLLSKGYQVFGFSRPLNDKNDWRVSKIKDKIEFVSGDLTDEKSVEEAVKRVAPDELYNLAAQSFTPKSYAEPVLTANINGLGPLRLLEAIKKHSPSTRMFQAGSSEMFGPSKAPQNELTPMNPVTPYATAKVFAFHTVKMYRERFNLFASNGILFTHDSPRRGEEFVTRRITDGVARIAAGKSKFVELGNIEAKRDWGYAKDYAHAAFMMLQHSIPDDFIVATGHTHTVKEFLQEAFSLIGVKNWSAHVKIDESLKRPTDIEYLGDNSKITKQLGWKQSKTFKEMVKEMVLIDLERHGAASALKA